MNNTYRYPYYKDKEVKVCQFHRICRINCKAKKPFETSSDQYACGFITPLGNSITNVNLIIVKNKFIVHILREGNNKYE
jgi:hypothetical protein